VVEELKASKEVSCVLSGGNVQGHTGACVCTPMTLLHTPCNPAVHDTAGLHLHAANCWNVHRPHYSSANCGRSGKSIGMR
jgi:hypothetical protein